MLQSLHQGPPNAQTDIERTLYASLSGPTEPIQGWRWQFASLLVMRHGTTTTNQSQNSSPRRGHAWIPHQIKSSRYSLQWVKEGAVSFLIGKRQSFWISWKPDRLWSLTATSQHCLSWRLEFSEQRNHTKFHTSLKTTKNISFLSWTVLPYTHHIV